MDQKIHLWKIAPTLKGFRMPALHLALFSLAAGLMLGSHSALAGAIATEIKQFSQAEIFAFLVLMLGPFKIIAPFLKITEGADSAVARRIAIQATVFSSATLLIAAVLCVLS